jgi:hypothetical protein
LPPGLRCRRCCSTFGIDRAAKPIIGMGPVLGARRGRPYCIGRVVALIESPQAVEGAGPSAAFLDGRQHATLQKPIGATRIYADYSSDCGCAA